MKSKSKETYETVRKIDAKINQNLDRSYYIIIECEKYVSAR